MHTPTLILHTLLAASGALATTSEGVSHPHKRAAALKNKNPKLTRAVPDKRDSSANPSYLTSKTERECYITGIPSLRLSFCVNILQLTL